MGRNHYPAGSLDGLFSPDNSAGANGIQLDLMSNALSDAHQRQLALKLWMAATADAPTAPDKRRRGAALAQMSPRNAFELADMVAGGSVDATQMVKAPKEAAREVGLEGDEVSRGGRRNKMAKIAARATSLEET